MTPVVMSVEGIGKVFRLYRHEISRVLRWFSLGSDNGEEKWVLRNVAFQVVAGQALAIVGRNGAGKSTLLKLITGVMRPSEGRVHISGRIAAILELGMGFNAEYTGRQNVYHGLGLMGHQREEIDLVVDQIKAFSELGDYFEQPLRIYSSGMHMRLAFSMVTAFRPDILIVDEALSVGDTYFQHKSFERIREFRKLGTTLILVSHDRMAMLSLCDRAILLHEGRVALDGDPESVLDYYNALLGQTADSQPIETKLLKGGKVQTISGTREVSIETVELLDEKGQSVDTIAVGQRVLLHITTMAHADVPRLVLGYSIKDRFGQTLYGTNSFYDDQVVEDVKAGETVHYSIGFDANLGEGSYSIALALVDGKSHLDRSYEWRDFALVFSVANLRQRAFDGALYLPADMTVRRTREE